MSVRRSFAPPLTSCALLLFPNATTNRLPVGFSSCTYHPRSRDFGQAAPSRLLLIVQPQRPLWHRSFLQLGLRVRFSHRTARSSASSVFIAGAQDPLSPLQPARRWAGFATLAGQFGHALGRHLRRSPASLVFAHFVHIRSLIDAGNSSPGSGAHFTMQVARAW